MKVYAVKAKSWKKAQSPKNKATLLKKLKRALNHNPDAKVTVTAIDIGSKTKNTLKAVKKAKASLRTRGRKKK